MFIKFVIKEEDEKYFKNKFPQFIYYVWADTDTPEQSIRKASKEHPMYSQIGFIVKDKIWNNIKNIAQGLYEVTGVNQLVRYLDWIRNNNYSMVMVCIDTRYNRKIIDKVAESYINNFFKNSSKFDSMNRSFKSRYDSSHYIGQLISAYDDSDRLPKLCTNGFHWSSTFFDACSYENPVALLKMTAKSPVDYWAGKSCCRDAIFEYMGEIKSHGTIFEIRMATQIINSNKNKTNPSRKSFICEWENWGRIDSSAVWAVGNACPFRYGDSRATLSVTADIKKLETLYKKCFSSCSAGSGFYEGWFVSWAAMVIDEERKEELKEFKKEFIKAFNKNHWDRWRKAISPLKASEFNKKFIALSFL